MNSETPLRDIPAEDWGQAPETTAGLLLALVRSPGDLARGAALVLAAGLFGAARWAEGKLRG